MSMDGQGTEWRGNITENFNRLSRAHELYRQTDERQTEGRRHSERERNTIAVNYRIGLSQGQGHSGAVPFYFCNNFVETFILN